jgi:hypothetical protein
MMMSDKYTHNMNSTEEQAPLNHSVETTQNQGEPGNQKRSRNRRRRNRNRNRRPKQSRHASPKGTHHTPQETEGTRLKEAQQNHSTYDHRIHHRSRGGTGYGYRHDVTQPAHELGGDQIPAILLPSYAENLKKINQSLMNPQEITDTEPTAVTDPTPNPNHSQ